MAILESGIWILSTILLLQTDSEGVTRLGVVDDHVCNLRLSSRCCVFGANDDNEWWSIRSTFPVDVVFYYFRGHLNGRLFKNQI